MDALSAFGAFLSGVGSVLGAFYALRRLRRRMEEDCRERIELFRQGLKLGSEMEESRDDRLRS